MFQGLRDSSVFWGSPFYAANFQSYFSGENVHKPTLVVRSFEKKSDFNRSKLRTVLSSEYTFCLGASEVFSGNVPGLSEYFPTWFTTTTDSHCSH